MLAEFPIEIRRPDVRDSPGRCRRKDAGSHRRFDRVFIDAVYDNLVHGCHAIRDERIADTAFQGWAPAVAGAGWHREMIIFATNIHIYKMAKLFYQLTYYNINA